jgi:hypothetical protein
MDPIHPIDPVAPNIAPVTPPPMAGRLDRDTPRGNGGKDGRRRKSPADPPAAQVSVEGADYSLDDPEDGDDSRLHISVTA